MCNFIKVKEKQYGDEIYLNLNNVVAIHPNANCVITNAIENTGEPTQMIFRFDNENMKKILEVLEDEKT